MKSFVLLISTERSGSNFITSLMNGHSQICGPPPSHLLRLFGTNRGNYGDLDLDSNWNTLIEDLVESFQCKLGSWSTTVTAEELRTRARVRSAAEVLRLVYEKEAEHDGASHVFVKENHTYAFAPFALAHFPDCRFVWLVRDPRDVASSWVSTRGIPGGVAKAVEIWVQDQTETFSLYHQLRDSRRLMLVRYEDLTRDTAGKLEEITDFLGLEYEEAMLDFYNQPRTVKNAKRIDAWGNLRRPVLRDNSGKHRQVLSSDERRYVELTCFEAMSQLGYACDIVMELPDAQTLSAELDTLRRSLNPGDYEIATEEERAIRAHRLAAIERVLARRL